MQESSNAQDGNDLSLGLENSELRDNSEASQGAGTNNDSENQDTSSTENKGPEPNIMYIGKVPTRITQTNEETGKTKEIIEDFVGDPPTKIQNGMDSYKLPAKELQLDGPFYHKNADQIVQLFPDLYKRYVKKGK